MSTSVAFLLMTGAVPLGSIWMGSAPHWSPPGLVGMPASQMSHSWRSPHSISACRPWRAPTRLVLDAFGCRLTTTILPGDGRRTQHDTLKRWVHQGLKEMQMRIRNEVCLFVAASPLAARRRLDGETLRKQQGLVPDFLEQHLCCRCRPVPCIAWRMCQQGTQIGQTVMQHTAWRGGASREAAAELWRVSVDLSGGCLCFGWVVGLGLDAVMRFLIFIGFHA